MNCSNCLENKFFLAPNTFRTLLASKDTKLSYYLRKFSETSNLNFFMITLFVSSSFLESVIAKLSKEILSEAVYIVPKNPCTKFLVLCDKLCMEKRDYT